MGGEYASAKIFLTTNTSGEAVDYRFKYTGRYISGQFILNFETRAAEDRAVGVMLMHVSPVRKEIDGCTTYWHHKKAKIVNEKFKLRKNRPQ